METPLQMPQMQVSLSMGGLDRSLTTERFPHYEVMTKESTLKDEVLIYKNPYKFLMTASRHRPFGQGQEVYDGHLMLQNLSHQAPNMTPLYSLLHQGHNSSHRMSHKLGDTWQVLRCMGSPC